MKIYALLATLALSGCYQSVNQHDIQRAIAYCGSTESIVSIYAGFAGDEAAICAKKSSSSLSKVTCEVKK